MATLGSQRQVQSRRGPNLGLSLSLFYFSSLYCYSAIKTREAILRPAKDPTPLPPFQGQAFVRAGVKSDQGRKVLS